VTLYEGSKHLGGQITLTDEVPFKEDLKAYHEYLARQVKKHPNIDLKLGVRVPPELIEQSDVNTAIISIGAKQRVSKVPGSEHAIPAMGAFHNPDKRWSGYRYICRNAHRSVCRFKYFQEGE